MASLPVPYDLSEAEMVEEPGGMTEDELASLCAMHQATSVAYYTAELAAEQEQAINYYYGKMEDLPSPEGSSSATDYSVSVMVDNMLAAVLKPFVSADEVVTFEPRGPEDVQAAEQATDYVNFIINCDNPGFQIMHDWFKDALLTKLGVVKIWWDENGKQFVDERVMNALELMQVQTDPGMVSAEPVGPGMFRVKFRRTEGRVKIENIPPEEFLISPMARSVEDADYVAHKPNNYTRSMLMLMGVDPEVVDSLPAATKNIYDDPRRMARYQDEDWNSTGSSASGINSKPNDRIDVLDEYVRVDFDGDGIAELRRVVRVNDIILLNEEIDYCPFATLCPVPMPHKVYGLSVADQSIETQRVKTAIKRGTLDNLYRSNNPRPVISERAYTQTTAEDLQSVAPGAEIRVADVGQIDWMTVPFAADKSFGMLEYVAQEGEERTGSYRKGHGMNSEALKKNSSDTATAASIDENARNERAEMVARIFAETGVKRMFRIILKLVHTYQQEARIVRLRNQFVPMDPRNWSPDMDLTISVGLGVGNKGEMIGQAMTVLDVMERLIQTPFASLVTADKVHNAVKRLLTATGVKNTDDFLNDPAQMPPEQPQADPAMLEAQAKLQLQQQDMQMRSQEAQMKIQLEQAKAQAALQVKQAEAQAKAQIERERDANKAALAAQRADFEARLAMMKADAELQLKREQIAIQGRLGQAKIDADLSNNRSGGSLSE